MNDILFFVYFGDKGGKLLLKIFGKYLCRGEIFMNIKKSYINLFVYWCLCLLLKKFYGRVFNWL